MTVRIETPRLVVRTFRKGDEDEWLAMITDPEVRRFLPGASPNASAFASALAQRHAMEADLGYAMWAVDEKATGAFIGQCGLRPAAAMDPSAGSEIDLAYHFNAKSWNKGYASEAVIGVLTYVFGPDGPVLDRVMAVAMPENTGSWRVMEKAGMRYEGTADYYGLTGLKKYAAERSWWEPPAPTRG